MKIGPNYLITNKEAFKQNYRLLHISSTRKLLSIVKHNNDCLNKDHFWQRIQLLQETK